MKFVFGDFQLLHSYVSVVNESFPRYLNKNKRSDGCKRTNYTNLCIISAHLTNLSHMHTKFLDLLYNSTACMF